MQRVVKTLILIFSVIIITASCEKKEDQEETMTDNNKEMDTSSYIVKMKGSVFSPVLLNIVKGSTVKWINDDLITHTVTEKNGMFNSGNLKPGATFNYTFLNSDSIDYKCTIHVGMEGMIIVE